MGHLKTCSLILLTVVLVSQNGTAVLWDDYVAQYGLSGIKTNHSDADALNDWAEYIFNGNPTNAADTGLMPTFDSASGQYSFVIRNDATLKAHVMITTNLLDAIWSTNESINITINDGVMGTNQSTVGTAGDRLFIRLLIEEGELSITYPASMGITTIDEWIAHVGIGSIYRSSGSDGGYYDGTALSTTATKGTTVSVSLTPGFAGLPYGEEVWRVWIDLNHDGDFIDPDEAVFAAGPTTSTVVSSFTLPTTYSFTGATRMRVSMRYALPPPSDTDFDWGEVEDYTFIIE